MKRLLFSYIDNFFSTYFLRLKNVALHSDSTEQFLHYGVWYVDSDLLVKGELAKARYSRDKDKVSLNFWPWDTFLIRGCKQYNSHLPEQTFACHLFFSQSENRILIIMFDKLFLTITKCQCCYSKSWNWTFFLFC